MPLGFKSDYLHRGLLHPRRAINLLKILCCKGRARANWYPAHVTIDPSSVCQLRCPYCIQSNYQQGTHVAREFLSYHDFLTIFNKVKGYVLMLDLFNWGEPFLNPDTVRMIKTASDNHIRVRISSNMSLSMSDEMAAAIVDSRLYRLTCAIDGPTQAVYAKYRVGGRLELAADSIRRIVAQKKARKARYPLVDWRMLVFEWNHEHVEQTRERALALGVDNFFADRGQFLIEGKKAYWDISERKWVHYEKRLGHDPATVKKSPSPCGFLYRSMIIGANGRNLVCCFSTFKSHEHRSLIENSLDEVWNAPEYRHARAFTFGKSSDRSRVHVLCQSCRDL